MSSTPSSEAEACVVRLEPHRHEALHEELDHWRSNVGGPVAVDGAPRAPDVITGLDVVSWNIAIGLGRLDRLLDRLRATAFAGTSAERPLVLLLQEAFRTDATVPDVPGGVHHGGKVPTGRRSDIAELARAHGLSLRYSPSMRNGTHNSDRGNAILSNVALTGAHAYLLPYVRQRRVVVTARIAGHEHITLVSAHLDTHGRPRDNARRTRPGAGRALQARALAQLMHQLGGSVIMGADLNTMFGMSDPAMRELVAGGMHPARRIGSWRHTFHTPLRLLLDHVMYRCEQHHIAHAEVVRVDEAPDDRTRGVFGSDHHPLLARFELAP